MRPEAFTVLPSLDSQAFAHQHRADVVVLKVEGNALRAIFEFRANRAMAFCSP